MKKDVKITINDDFIETKYSGYFWNIVEKKLYSIKSGKVKVIQPVKLSTIQWLNTTRQWSYKKPQLLYRVSHNGKPKYLYENYLYSLTNETYVEYKVTVYDDGSMHWVLLNGDML